MKFKFFLTLKHDLQMVEKQRRKDSCHKQIVTRPSKGINTKSNTDKLSRYFDHTESFVNQKRNKVHMTTMGQASLI